MKTIFEAWGERDHQFCQVLVLKYGPECIKNMLLADLEKPVKIATIETDTWAHAIETLEKKGIGVRTWKIVS